MHQGGDKYKSIQASSINVSYSHVNYSKSADKVHALLWYLFQKDECYDCLFSIRQAVVALHNKLHQ